MSDVYIVALPFGHDNDLLITDNLNVHEHVLVYRLTKILTAERWSQWVLLFSLKHSPTSLTYLYEHREEDDEEGGSDKHVLHRDLYRVD